MTSSSIIPMFTLWQLPVEATMLALGVIIGLVQVVLAASAQTAHRGLAYGLSARDEPGAPLGKHAGRIVRALENFKETFPLFAIAVLVAAASGRLSPTTALGAELYIAARILFVPVYVAGLPVVRTLVWAVSIAGIIIVLVGAATPQA